MNVCDNCGNATENEPTVLCEECDDEDLAIAVHQETQLTDLQSRVDRLEAELAIRKVLMLRYEGALERIAILGINTGMEKADIAIAALK